MKKSTSLFMYGFAIFAMFFGSGNLVFPLKIGLSSGADWAAGFLGLFLTGIILPFLGLFVIKLHRGDYIAFFDGAGKTASILVPLLLLSLLGSFGVVPRCITVAHGGINYMTPGVSLALFSSIFCILTYIMCLKDRIMMRLLGKWMSPILLGLLTILIIVGIFHAPTAPKVSSSTEAIIDGFLTGYQTMDMLAAFFFSALVFKQIQDILPQTTNLKKLIIAAIKPSILGALMLAIVYLGFVFISAHYREVIPHDIAPELILPSIATYTLGASSALIIGLAIIFSCLTTAVALNNIYARYLVSLFNLNERYFPIILMITTVISFAVSLLDFKGISAFLGPVLEILYPSLILLTIASILTPQHQRIKTLMFWGLIFVMIVWKHLV